MKSNIKYSYNISPNVGERLLFIPLNNSKLHILSSYQSKSNYKLQMHLYSPLRRLFRVEVMSLPTVAKNQTELSASINLPTRKRIMEDERRNYRLHCLKNYRLHCLKN